MVGTTLESEPIWAALPTVSLKSASVPELVMRMLAPKSLVAQSWNSVSVAAGRVTTFIYARPYKTFVFAAVIWWVARALLVFPFVSMRPAYAPLLTTAVEVLVIVFAFATVSHSMRFVMLLSSKPDIQRRSAWARSGNAETTRTRQAAGIRYFMRVLVYRCIGDK